MYCSPDIARVRKSWIREGGAHSNQGGGEKYKTVLFGKLIGEKTTWEIYA
jgi:hypothetical protein